MRRIRRHRYFQISLFFLIYSIIHVASKENTNNEPETADSTNQKESDDSKSKDSKNEHDDVVSFLHDKAGHATHHVLHNKTAAKSENDDAVDFLHGKGAHATHHVLSNKTAAKNENDDVIDFLHGKAGHATHHVLNNKTAASLSSNATKEHHDNVEAHVVNVTVHHHVANATSLASQPTTPNVSKEHHDTLKDHLTHEIVHHHVTNATSRAAKTANITCTPPAIKQVSETSIIIYPYRFTMKGDCSSRETLTSNITLS